MTTISQGATTLTPDQVLGYEAETESTNVEHKLVGGGMKVSLGIELPRAGELQLFFLDRADAWAAHQLHASTGVFTLVDPDLPELNMTYVRKGRMTIALEPQTRTRWLVTVGFREVLS